jgi:hypothetical protein
VVDKYIEFELILVLIDIFLLRKPAYRHLLYNRFHYLFPPQPALPLFRTWTSRGAARGMPVVCVALSVVLKCIVLRQSSWRELLHSALSSSTEHFVFILTVVI